MRIDVYELLISSRHFRTAVWALESHETDQSEWYSLHFITFQWKSKIVH